MLSSHRRTLAFHVRWRHRSLSTVLPRALRPFHACKPFKSFKHTASLNLVNFPHLVACRHYLAIDLQTNGWLSRVIDTSEWTSHLAAHIITGHDTFVSCASPRRLTATHEAIFCLLICLTGHDGSSITHSCEVSYLQSDKLVVLSSLIFCLLLLLLLYVVSHEFEFNEFIGWQLWILDQVLFLVIGVLWPVRKLFARGRCHCHVLLESASCWMRLAHGACCHCACFWFGLGAAPEKSWWLKRLVVLWVP